MEWGPRISLKEEIFVNKKIDTSAKLSFSNGGKKARYSSVWLYHTLAEGKLLKDTPSHDYYTKTHILSVQ